MIDVQGPLLTAGLVAVIGALVQIYSILQDRKHTRSKDERKTAKEPLDLTSKALGNLDLATVIQQRMIDSQGEEIQKLTLRVATLTSENKVLREQMMDMFIQIREMERRNGTPFNPRPPDDPT